MKLSEWLERYEIKDDFVPAHPHAANVIIGIGTDVSRDGRKVSPQSAAIVETIADFYSCFRSEDILFTGGYSYKGGPTEAETMYDHLITLMTAADKKDIKHPVVTRNHARVMQFVIFHKKFNLKRRKNIAVGTLWMLRKI